MRRMRVHILGSGGREHAIGWAFSQQGYEVHFYPGNAGTKRDGTNHPYEGEKTIKGISDEDVIIPGSEEYLVEGVANWKSNVFGPIKEVARLEGSKVFAKRFMKKYGIRTARFEVAETPEELKEKIKKFSPPYVIKADGLARGKGVLILDSEEEAIEKGSKLITGELIKGVKGPVVIDEYLEGEELSAMAIVNGRDFVILPFVRDYKRLLDNDRGPNTGGMGSWGPVSVSQETVSKIEELFDKTLWGVEKEGYTYRGFLYLGLMLHDGDPYILEYNVRLGDPETEVIVVLNPEAFVNAVLEGYRGGRMEAIRPNGFAVDVVLASKGYPDNPEKGKEITLPEDGLIFFAGVAEKDGKLVTAGGRVLHCMGSGATREEARKKAYELAERVQFEGKMYRRDIAS
ncbi:MAG TPA: phosphoribosylamine--glycine ligase [Thermotoga neapolitana]|uniref:Phosphoribosylamine--glycine ligase n=2 Tax=Thermotoga neapolitana TaxID=2337 RepID=B9K967_THENN|nr:Phosphoribosylamine--glycine ligase [Thermotoga neapolitana DSM 4359]HBF10163.1 phosphoribosylamine--glycine ligase [Thermotoga neapolitana]